MNYLIVGAKIPPDTEVSHLFFLNFDPQNPFCKGVEGILEAYQQALRKGDTFDLILPIQLFQIVKRPFFFSSPPLRSHKFRKYDQSCSRVCQDISRWPTLFYSFNHYGNK